MTASPDSTQNSTIEQSLSLRALGIIEAFYEDALSYYSEQFSRGVTVCAFCRTALAKPKTDWRECPFCETCQRLIPVLDSIRTGQRDRAVDGLSVFNDHLHPIHHYIIEWALDYAECNEHVDLPGLATAIALGLAEIGYDDERSDALALNSTRNIEAGAIALVNKRCAADLDFELDRLRFSRIHATDIALEFIGSCWVERDIDSLLLLRRLDEALERIFRNKGQPFDLMTVWQVLANDSIEGASIRRMMPYNRYLLTDHWQQTRRDAIDRSGRRCQVCNISAASLNVHHRTYERRGAELPEDLIVLCRKCHETFHKNGRLAR